MRLELVEAQQVVRHATNGSFYRVERPEKGRMRVWPLELFPTGLLIAKSAPTIVAGDMEVIEVGAWTDEMVVEGKPKHTLAWYEKTLAGHEAELIVLEAQFEQLPADGKGKESRGSWQNKINACRAKIATFRRGLGFDRESAVLVTVISQDTNVPAFSKDDLVQLPSGLPAAVVRAGKNTVIVRTKHRGEEVRASLPAEILMPWRMAAVCTV